VERGVVVALLKFTSAAGINGYDESHSVGAKTSSIRSAFLVEHQLVMEERFYPRDAILARLDIYFLIAVGQSTHRLASHTTVRALVLG